MNYIIIIYQRSNFYLNNKKFFIVLFLPFIYLFSFTNTSANEALIFHSGFENNTTITNSSSGPNIFDFTGQDLSVSSPNRWTTDLETRPYISSAFILTGPEYINESNFPSIVTDPKNPSNKVLRFKGVYPNCYLDRGYWNGYRSQADIWVDQTGKRGQTGFNTLYYKVKLLVPNDFEVMQNRNESIGWFTIAEFNNDDHGNVFRMTLTMAKLNNTGPDTLKFRLTTQTLNGTTWSSVFTKNNLNFTIPLEQWMELEINIIEGDNTTGKFYLAVTPQGESKKIIFNETTYTRHPIMTEPDGLAYSSLMKMYTYGYLVDAFRNSGKVMQLYWDDFEIWKDKVVIPLLDTTAPIITSFSIPTTSSTLTVSNITLSATDTVGVTGYLLSESSTIPNHASGPWSSTPQTSYPFTTAGVKTLYAFAKDAAGNVSSSSSDAVTITISPVTKTLYSWVKDAAGNVSNSLSANVKITLPATP